MLLLTTQRDDIRYTLYVVVQSVHTSQQWNKYRADIHLKTASLRLTCVCI